MAARIASADPARCAAGADFATKRDLPRAALYLDGCDTPEAAAVAKQLRASTLSSISISTSPAGMVAETDALPGERFVTPATIWTKAGTFKVTVAADAAAFDTGQVLISTITVAPRSRGTVVLSAPPAAAAPRTGSADFTDETPEQTAHEGPPAAVKHGTMIPKKYLKQTPPPSGGELEDPFATRADTTTWHLALRFGGGVADENAARFAASLAVIASRPVAARAALVARLDARHAVLDTLGTNVGLAVVALDRREVSLGASVALRGEVRVQDQLAMQPVTRAGLGVAVDVDASFVALPVSLGVRFEQGLTELMPGARARAMFLELGYEWR